MKKKKPAYKVTFKPTRDGKDIDVRVSMPPNVDQRLRLSTRSFADELLPACAKFTRDARAAVVVAKARMRAGEKKKRA